MNETAKQFQLHVFLKEGGGGEDQRGEDARSSPTVMLTGPDRLLRGEPAPMSGRPGSAGVKRVSEQRCSTKVQ